MQHRIDRQNGPSPGDSLTFVVAMPNRLDCEAITALLRASSFRIASSSHELTKISAFLASSEPDVLLIGAGFERSHTLRVIDRFLTEPGGVVAFIDSHFALFRANDILNRWDACYFTKDQSIEQIVEEILAAKKIALESDRLPGAQASVEKRLQRFDHAGLLTLTSREQDVLRLLADAHSTKDVAHLLGVAESTVGNHKARLMRKLGAHKSTELVRLAIQSGLTDAGSHGARRPATLN
jgi:DNA-binding NarL/FixJ family response regulator